MGTTDNFDTPASSLNLAATDQIPIRSASTGRGAYLTGTQLKDGLQTLIGTDKFIAAGATLTVTAALHSGRTIKLDTAAGSVVTLPAATGSGNVYEFVVSVLATSNSHIVKVANASDAMQGIIFSMDDTSANAVAFAAVAGTDDTITLNRSTTGSVTIGERLTVTDFATNRFQVSGFVTNTGTPATQFSATV